MNRTIRGQQAPRRHPHQASRGRAGIPRERFPRMEIHQRGSAQPGNNSPVSLVTNAYRLGLKTPGTVVHEYQLKVSTSMGCKDISPEVLCRSFVAKSIRELLMRDIVPNLVTNRKFARSVVIEFGLKAIYSIDLFRSPESVGGPKSPAQALVGAFAEQRYVFENISVATDLLSNLNIDIELKYLRSFSLDSSELDVELTMSILNHQLLLNMLRFGSVYYFSHGNKESSSRAQEARLDLISRHAMGIALSGIRRCTLDQNFVVISCTHSYITQSHRLIDLLATFIHEKPSHDPEQRKLSEIESATGTEEWFLSFCSILNGFKCRTSGFGKQMNLRFSLTDQPSTALASSNDPANTMTVYEFYKQNGTNLKYPNLPCLKSRSVNHPYIPLELCHLLPNQKVPIFRLSSTARNHLLQLNKPKPDVYKQSSVEAKERIAQDIRVQFKSYGLEMSSEPMETQGSILQKPILRYQNRSVEPVRDYWESGVFCETVQLVDNWCVVDTVSVDPKERDMFFAEFSQYCARVGFRLGRPHYIEKPKQTILDSPNCLDSVVEQCQRLTRGRLRFLMFIIDSSSTPLNRLIHLTFDDRQQVTAACLRSDSVLNQRNHRSIFRTLVHKLNARLGGTNFTFHEQSLSSMSMDCKDLMVIGLDVTHPDNELNGVSIVGCAYTFSSDLFRHRSLVWPQAARVEIIGKMDQLISRLLGEFYTENRNRLPKQIIIYRDGVSHEEFDRVRDCEVAKTLKVIESISLDNRCPRPELSYIIAQKRHTMRFFQMSAASGGGGLGASNPPGGTLVDQDVVLPNGREFYLYSNTSPQATARPIHYHVLTNGLGVENLQKLTYYLCFNFGKCSGTLSMPSSLRYAHNAAYDARNRVIASREFSANKFYTSKFFC